jgi:hypothetical protein
MRVFSDSKSQAGQESFVLSMLNEKRGGYYVEVGGYHPFDLSNTYLLESQFGWHGVALEIDPSRADFYNQNRRNPCVAADALTFNFESYFIEHDFPRQIDYLQLDIEPPQKTLACLLSMPMTYRYSVITFEHDAYANGTSFQQQGREFLEANGYKLTNEDILFNAEFPFEDWYVDSSMVKSK